MTHYLKKIFNHHTFMFILLICIGLGIYLSLEQFIFNRNLWLDEIALAINIRDRSFLELLQPLSDNQAAPIAFLYLEKLMITLFGSYDYILRIFPLVSFIFSIPLVYLLTVRLLKNRIPALLASAIFSTSYMLIRYSDEVKQYSSDLLFTLIIFYLTLKLDFKNRQHILYYALSGAIIIWFSNISVIILLVAGLYIFYIQVIQEKNFKFLSIYFFWLLSFGIYYTFFIYNHPTTAFMKSVWHAQFLPSDILSMKFYTAIASNIQDIYIHVLTMGDFWIFALVITLLSIITALIKRQYVLLLFFFGPLIVQIIMSTLHLYPFYARFVLYLMPMFIIMLAYGLYILYLLIKKYIHPVAAIIYIFFTFYYAYDYINLATKHIPFAREEITSSLNYIESHIAPDDSIYLYYTTVPSFAFYMDNKLDGHTVHIGTEHRNNYKDYYPELNKLNGRVWLVFIHIHGHEEWYIMDYLLHEKGVKILERKSLAFGTLLYYIDIDQNRTNPIHVVERRDTALNMMDLENHIKKDDNIYVYYGAKEAFDFYKTDTISKHNIIYGTPHRDNPSLYKEELDKLHGKTWVFFQHFYDHEEKYMIDYLRYKKQAYQRYTKRENNGAIYYFDIK